MSRIVSVFLCWLLACSGPDIYLLPNTDHPHSPTLETPKVFRVLTYNVFHGLQVGNYWVNQVESAQHHQERFQLQIRQLVQAQPDLIFLQEVNPLPQRAVQYVQELTGHGLEYSEIHQVDSCGWRLTQNIALIDELNNGLVILGKRRVSLREIEGLRLSGPGECHDSWGIQFGELRYALIGEMIWPGTEEHFLLVNVHLHSGIESDAYFLNELMDSHQQGRLQHFASLKEALRSDQEERLQELQALNEELENILAADRYDGVVIAGDFNFEKNSPGYKKIVAEGAINTATLKPHETTIQTIDPRMDPLAKEQAEASLDLVDQINDERPEDRKEILSDYQENIDRPRKVDFIFILPIHPNFVLKNRCVKHERFGIESSASGVSGSDHYGDLITYTFTNADCGGERMP